jgi:hypothetical protein
VNGFATVRFVLRGEKNETREHLDTKTKKYERYKIIFLKL